MKDINEGKKRKETNVGFILSAFLTLASIQFQSYEHREALEDVFFANCSIERISSINWLVFLGEQWWSIAVRNEEICISLWWTDQGYWRDMLKRENLEFEIERDYVSRREQWTVDQALMDEYFYALKDN